MSALDQLDDTELHRLHADVVEELHRRAVERGDHEALTTHGFEHGFDTKGLPRRPWIASGLLICPGARIDRSGHSHDCGFVSIDGSWVWDSDWLLHDRIRHHHQPKSIMQSISLVVVTDRMNIDLVYSSMRNGIHNARRIHSFTVVNGELQPTTSRTFDVSAHR